ncbi:MAG: hypothetical protein ABIR33_10630 [Pyrinomonadaceae bacterium]
MRRTAANLIFLICLSCSALGQAIEAGWKGVLPLVSSKSDVEKAYGKPERVDDNGYYSYRMADSFVQVNYATEPCRPNQYNRGRFNVPANTVLDVWVSIHKTILLKELKYDGSKYLRDASGHTGVFHYVNRESSIMISTSIQDAESNEYVGRIEYRAAERLKTKFACD